MNSGIRNEWCSIRGHILEGVFTRPVDIRHNGLKGEVSRWIYDRIGGKGISLPLLMNVLYALP